MMVVHFALWRRLGLPIMRTGLRAQLGAQRPILFLVYFTHFKKKKTCILLQVWIWFLSKLSVQLVLRKHSMYIILSQSLVKYIDGIWNRSNIWMEYGIGQIYGWNIKQVKYMHGIWNRSKIWIQIFVKNMDGIGRGPQ